MLINKTYLLKKMSAMGVAFGDVLFVHSALAAIGKLEGGADELLDALLEAVGPEGTVIFPTFTWVGPFSAEETPSFVGILGEIFRHRPGAIRSSHPTHSVVAIGKRSEEFAGDKWVTETTCGEGSVYLRLAHSNAKVMMLGVDLNRCTLLHAFEDQQDYIVPQVTITPPVARPDITQLKRYPSGHRGFIFLMEGLREKEWFVQGYLGNARTLLFPANEMFLHCKELLKQDPYTFLCNNKACNGCAYVRGGMKPTTWTTGACTNDSCEVCTFEAMMNREVK